MGELTAISKRSLQHFRTQTDPIADAVIEQFFPQNKDQLFTCLQSLDDNSKKLNDTAGSALIALYDDAWNKASVLDGQVLSKGQKFFNEHASDIMLLLGMLSLPYCYAAANGAEVLVRSKRILDEPEKRLLETAEFVFNVSARNAFEKKGKALPEILKVRLMHAAARWYAKNASDWNTETLGEPVNQEDMAGTNLAFSLIVIRGLKKLGKSISSAEAYDYINYWNQIGRLLGLDEKLLPESNKAAYVLERNIRERQFSRSEAGIQLTRSLLMYFESATQDSPMKGLSKAMVEYLLGDLVSDLLEVNNSSFDKVSFQPIKYFLKFQNQLSLKNDSYAVAFQQFRQIQQQL